MDHSTPDRFPLSPMQEGMLFNYLREPHSGVDIEQLVVHLPEALDVPRLITAWQRLLERYDILRARFVWEGVKEPLHEIQPEVSLPFNVESRCNIPEMDRFEVLRSFLKVDRIRGVDLRCSPMLRLTLFQWSEISYSLVWTFHHALFDGRCYSALLREVFELYEEIGVPAFIDRPTPPSYRQYIDWIRKQDFNASESFWRELLGGFVTPTPLIADHNLQVEKISHPDGEAWANLDKETTETLHKFAADNQLTVNTLVMGAWAILLHRYTGEADIVFGAVRACRRASNPCASETVGLFINTVPVRVHIYREARVNSVLQALRQQWIAMRPHEHSPLSKIRMTSQVPPGQPLFETLVVFEKQRLDETLQSLGERWTARQIDLHEMTNFPIALAAYDGPELSFKVMFNRHRFGGEFVQRMLGHLGQLFKGMALHNLLTVGELPLMTQAEREQVLYESNNVVKEPSHSYLRSDAPLHVLFESQVSRRPDGIALTCGEDSLTYAELNRRANHVAWRLVEAGVKPEMLVGLSIDRSNKLVIALLAILKAGGAYLPIDLAYPPDRSTFMLTDANAPILLTERKLRDRLPATKSKVLYIDDLLASQRQLSDDVNPSSGTGLDNLAYVIYTSGTTSMPKGSLITHRNVVRLFSSTEQWYQFHERDVWTLFHSTAFDFSVWELWGALLYGGRVVVVPFLVSRSPDAFYDLLAREQVTVLNQTPSAFRQLIQAEESIGQKPLALRYVIFGGEALELQSLRPWFERHGDQSPRLVNMYGITETTVHVTYRPLSKNDVKLGSVIGVPIPDLRLYILDASRQLVPFGIPGEIYVGGEGLARGYLNRPELTAERFVCDTVTGHPDARLYRTGDLARRLPCGDIEYLGRIDHQVKIRGYRIELGEIESVLCEHPKIQEALVMAREDKPGAKRLVAYVVARQSWQDPSELREQTKRKLPEYMVPAAIVFLDKFPLTASGKIDHKALPIPESGHPYSTDSEASLAPQSDLERQLASIWAQALGLSKVGVEENFFELGGDSILIVQVHRKLREQLRFELPLVALFEYPTIRALASRLNESGSSVSVDDVEKQLLARASRQKEALAQMKAKRGTT